MKTYTNIIICTAIICMAVMTTACQTPVTQTSSAVSSAENMDSSEVNMISAAESGSKEKETNQIKNESTDVSSESNKKNEESGQEPKRVMVISGVLPYQTVDELSVSSSEIAVARVIGVNPSIEITSVSGEKEIFTDYILEVEKPLLGERSEGEQITVRLEGGQVGTDLVIDETGPVLESETEYLVFLQEPLSGGFNTEGDYYYINGGVQGIYLYNENEMMIAQSQDERSAIEYSLFEQSLLNSGIKPVQKADMLQNYIDNLRHNLDNHLITQEQYDEYVAELNEYAQITAID